jgi:hypothetical protein
MLGMGKQVPPLRRRVRSGFGRNDRVLVSLVLGVAGAKALVGEALTRR